MLLRYCRYCLRNVYHRSKKNGLLKAVVIVVVVYFLISFFPQRILRILQSPGASLHIKYFIRARIEQLYPLRNQHNNNNNILGQNLELQFQEFETNSSTNGLVFILESYLPADTVEGFRRFLSLQLLISSTGYSTVLPLVRDGYYFTLNCTYRSTRVDTPLSIHAYFDIQRLQTILHSYSVREFVSLDKAVKSLFTKVKIVLFVYNEDVVEIPNPSLATEKRSMEFSYLKRDRILKGKYVNNCFHNLRSLSVYILEELSALSKLELELTGVICVDAMQPVNLKTFHREIGFDTGGTKFVFINWRGYQDTKRKVLDPKLTLNQTVHDHILIIPLSHMVTKATESYLSHLSYPTNSYLSAVIDLQHLQNLKQKLSRKDFNDCMDQLYYSVRRMYNGYYRLVITSAFHPLREDFDSYSNTSLFELVSVRYSRTFTPVAPPHSGLTPFQHDRGFSFLVDLNIVRHGAALVILSDKSEFRSLHSYYYDYHIADFTNSYKNFGC